MKKVILMSLAVFLFSSIVYTQNSDELLKKLVEKNILTQVEAEEIKNESNKAESQKPVTGKIEKVRNMFNTPYMQFGGYGQLMYRYSDVSKVHNDFKAKNLFISVSGKLNNSFRYGFLIEFVNPSVQEFWGEWTAAEEFNLKVGQFKVPVTIESLLAPSNLETVAYTRSISNLFGYATEDDVLYKQNNKNNFGRDPGIQMSGELFSNGDYKLLQYSLGMFQGMGVNTSEKNNTKDFAGTIMLQPVKGFRIGGGTYLGQATYSLDNESAVADHVRNRWIVSSEYKSDRFYGRAEWLNGNDGGIKKEGLYGMGLYYIMPKRLNILAKVDYYNRNKDVNSEATDYTLGLNYYFYTQCRIQLNYTYSDYSKKWGDKNSNVIAAQLQLAF